MPQTNHCAAHSSATLLIKRRFLRILMSRQPNMWQKIMKRQGKEHFSCNMSGFGQLGKHISHLGGLTGHCLSEGIDKQYPRKIANGIVGSHAWEEVGRMDIVIIRILALAWPQLPSWLTKAGGTGGIREGRAHFDQNLSSARSMNVGRVISTQFNPFFLN